MHTLATWIAGGLMALSSFFAPHSEVTLGANQKVTELTGYTSAISTDVLPIVDISSSATKKITLSSLFNFLSGTTTYMRDFSAASGTTTNAYVTNFLGASSTIQSLITNTHLAIGSTTLQTFTGASSTIGILLTNRATTTDLFVSNLASTTNLRANSAVIGDQTVRNITILGTCAGCSTASGITMYVATSSTNRYMAKTLALVAGDVVVWWGSGSGNNCGAMSYRISAPNQNSTTTLFSDSSCADDIHSVGPGVFHATTTSTVTFDWVAGTPNFSSMVLQLQSIGFTNQF